jgi:hypothetical protein
MEVAVVPYMCFQPTPKDKKKYDTKHHFNKKIWLYFHLLDFSY